MTNSAVPLKELFAKGRLAIGTGVSLGSLRSVEIVANTSFDFAMVDTMHGHFDKSGATDAIRSLLRSGPAPLARVSENAPGLINDQLDAGALGVVIPMVESRAAAQAAVEATYYPPVGRRSKGSVASVVHGAGYADRANDLVSLIVMIETPEAVAAADEILSVHGITGCLIGASDLQFVLGVGRDSAEFLRAVDLVVAAGRRHHVAIGISIGEADEVAVWSERGVSFFLASHDLSILSEAIQRFDASFRSVRGGIGDGT